MLRPHRDKLRPFEPLARVRLYLFAKVLPDRFHLNGNTKGCNPFASFNTNDTRVCLDIKYNTCTGTTKHINNVSNYLRPYKIFSIIIEWRIDEKSLCECCRYSVQAA